MAATRLMRGGWKTTVLLAPKIDFIELLRHRPELALRMLASMSQHLRVLVALLDDLTSKDMESRLANCLLKRCPRPLPNDSVVIQLDRTKRVLAAEMGATSETLSRTMATFRDQKLLQIKGKTLTVTKPRALQRLLQTNLSELQSGPGRCRQIEEEFRRSKPKVTLR